MNPAAPGVVVDLARRLPAGDIARLAAAAGSSGSAGIADLRGRVAGPALREACDRILELPDLDSSWLAGALSGAASAFEAANRAQDLDVVWTGPDSNIDTGRLTAPAVVELIDAARSELLLVSYATHHEPRILDALRAAAARAVDITLLLERNVDNPGYTATADAFGDLPARRWTWPLDQRSPGAALHAKIIVVDAQIALVGSANLTGRAIAHNLECGVLIRGGPQPRAIRDHLWSLCRSGVLRAV